MAKQNLTCMYLDVGHLNAEKFRKRFPTICRLCEEFDIDITKDRIPVRPAAHYMIGGLVVDENARTTMPGLLACGEAASSGVHGANRLASNSLLEGLVFGRVAGTIAGEAAAGSNGAAQPKLIHSEVERSQRTALDLADVLNSLRSVMWRNVGIERTGARLAETEEIIQFWGRYMMDKLFDDQLGWETQNLLTVARLMTASALARQESRGVHFRTDYPEMSPKWDGQHVIVERCSPGLKLEVR